jgi:hypothetical protein
MEVLLGVNRVRGDNSNREDNSEKQERPVNVMETEYLKRATTLCSEMSRQRKSKEARIQHKWHSRIIRLVDELGRGERLH